MRTHNKEKLKRESVGIKWSNTQEKAAYGTALNYTNLTEIIGLGKYLFKIRSKQKINAVARSPYCRLREDITVNRKKTVMAV